MAGTGNGDSDWFDAEKRFHEALYLRGTNPRQQSGFGRDERDWERFRKPIVAAIRTSGTFLDIGCANGLLMEDVSRWARADGYPIEPTGSRSPRHWLTWHGNDFRNGGTAFMSAMPCT